MNAKCFALGLVWLFASFVSVAQNYSNPTIVGNAQSVIRPKVAIFMPLYLDSTFDAGGSYKFGTNVPKFALPGLEFYSGVQLALDSLEEEGLNAEIFIIDTKDKYKSINAHINEIKDIALVIGMTQNVGEMKTLADAARSKNIPFISATLPNDGGISDNPSLVILNSTLKTHCQAVFQFVQKNYSTDNLVFLHKSGTQEDKIKSMLNEANRNTSAARLNWKEMDMSENVSVGDLVPLLDSNKNNIIVCGTLDANFGANVIRQLSTIRKTYRSTIIGMPTWDDLRSEKADFKGVEIIYPTPFLTASGNTGVYNSVSKQFKANSHSRPSDMVFRGFEVTYHFVKNLLSNPSHILDLSDRRNKIFSDFDLESVIIKKNQESPDYYENKKVYFVRKMDGILKGTN